MSFSGGLTQNQIEVRLEALQAKTHRLITTALKSSIVRVEIAERPRQCLQHEDSLRARFGLKSRTVVPIEGAPLDTTAAIAAIAVTSAQFLANLLASAKLRQFGVGMGRTLKSALEVLPKLSRLDRSIVSVSGSLTRMLPASPYDAVQAFRARVGGEGY
jgi:DNA-binding transcriptional regulator LsrR (DeoR family)